MSNVKAAREQALMFLEEVNSRSNNLAESIDPKRKRNYERDPILKALDAIGSITKRTITQVKTDRSRRTHSKSSQVRCELCAPLLCKKAR